MKNMTEEKGSERLEALERAVQEIDALRAIYGGCDDEKDSNDYGCFKIVFDEQLQEARRFVETGVLEGEGPMLGVELQLDVLGHEGEQLEHAPLSSSAARLRFCLPPGYPLKAAKVSAVSMGILRFRSDRDNLLERLASRAENLKGNEAIMELVQEAQEIISELTLSRRTELEAGENPNTHAMSTEEEIEILSRRWIWVHHIKDSGRCKDIVREARGLSLGGYLKAGYPGIVVVEGETKACDEFVGWIKGNKSRPGGFGRNWGHHVRGEIITGSRQMPEFFEELGDDLGTLGALCKEHELESEFLAYVMQHNAK